MDLKEVQISEIKNLNLVYIFTTDNILKGKSERYIAAKVVYDENRTFALDFKDPLFEKFIRRIIERYHKEKESRNIILLGDLTKRIVQDENFETIETIPTQKIVGISMFDTKNYELKKYESFLFDTLTNILKIVKGYESVTIDKIDGYNHKYVVYYHVGSVALEMRLIISFRDKTHIDFQIAHVDGNNFNIKGTIVNNINNVRIIWESPSLHLSGQTFYAALTQTTEKKIVSNDQTIFYSEDSETIIPEDRDLISFYSSILNIDPLSGLIKTGEYNYLLGEKEDINNVDTDIFYKDSGVEISIGEDLVIIRYRVVNGLSKYNNQINVTLSSSLVEVTLSKLVVDKVSYILLEEKNTNDFGSTYKYRVYQVEDFDFRKPFVSNYSYEIDTDINSIHDIKRYIKYKEGEKKDGNI